MSSVRSRFSSICDALPDSARRELLDDLLLPLLDKIPPVERMRIMGVAESTNARFADMPRLDLAAKKAEVDALFDELKRDINRGVISSRRDEISAEVVESLVSWLSTIWQVVFEYSVDFQLAHECLLYSSKALLQFNTAGSGCKCGIMNMYIPVAIKDRRGKTIKHFSYPSALYLEDAFLWIWRDMLLKILVAAKQQEVALIPKILRDIQVAYSDWTPLSRLLVAGGKTPIDDCDSEDSDDMGFEEEDTDGDEMQCPSHATHWPESLFAQLPALHSAIAHSLLDTFKLTPSQPLYSAIVSLAPSLRSQLVAHLEAAVTYSGAAAAAALDIHALNGDASAVFAVLTAAQPVLRARDAPAMQRAVRSLARTPHAPAALAIVARELGDCVEVMRGHVTSAGAFGALDCDEARTQLADVLRLHHDTLHRQERVERWVDIVSTASPSAGNPLTFAAFLMGFPPGFESEDTEEPDPFLFAGIKDDDPEYEDLREEWRPRLKERFEGWVSTAEMIKSGGQELLVRVARTVVEVMPFLRGADIVDEMITRIQDRPTRHHICDALEALSSFSKVQRTKALAVQRKKALAERNKAEKRKKAASASLGKKSGPKRSRTADAGPSTFADAYVDDNIMPGLEALD